MNLFKIFENNKAANKMDTLLEEQSNIKTDIGNITITS